MRAKTVESGIEVCGLDENKPRVPQWFGEAVLLGKYWQESGLVEYLQEEVRVLRGRMGWYEVLDFVLLLNSYAISGEPTLKHFFQALEPVKEVLMSLWGRQRCPSASSLSRFLAAVDQGAVESLRELFEVDLGRNGLKVNMGMGLYDRSQEPYVVFDVDGTVCAVRQRSLEAHKEQKRPSRRRSELSCAPGYKGRKRGEVIRTRTTVAQAHTGEWLGTYGGVGNGDAKGDLVRACQVIERYLSNQGLTVAHGLVRLDGLYGTAAKLSELQQRGLGYIVRCSDYHLLQDLKVEQQLEKSTAQDWQALGGNSCSEVLDVGYLEDWGRGYASPMRLLVVRTPAARHRGGVGKQLGEWVYELFLTSQSCASLSWRDVLSVYRGRGGFEQRLSEEDLEQDYDRWCSWHPTGQEFWQILAQWSWNWREWMGHQQQVSPQPVRQTIWAEVEEPDNERAASAPSAPALTPSLMFLQPPAPKSGALDEPSVGIGNRYGPMRVSTEWGRGKSKGKGKGKDQGLGKNKQRFGNQDFKIVDDQTVVCPAGHVMYRRSCKQKANGDLALQFGVYYRICQQCPVKKQCLAPNSKGVGGRRVNVIRKFLAQPTVTIPTCSAVVRSVSKWLNTPQPSYQHPLLWCDIAATHLRRDWHETLALHEVKINALPNPDSATPSPNPQRLSRRQRAHARLGWWERIKRNERLTGALSWRVELYGQASALVEGLEVLSRQPFSATRS